MLLCGIAHAWRLVLKLWDLRAREKPVFEDKTSESSICHVHACRGSGPGNEGRCMLVSSNDNGMEHGKEKFADVYKVDEFLSNPRVQSWRRDSRSPSDR